MNYYYFYINYYYIMSTKKSTSNTGTHPKSKIDAYLKIKKIGTINTPFKKVFSTNVFIPRELNLGHKSFSYLTGFIKLVETFKKMTNWEKENPENNWGLVIFCDNDLFTFDEKYIKTTYDYHLNNTSNNLNIKQKYIENENIIIKLYSLYDKYIKHIKNDPKKYDFVKIYTFEDTRLKSTKEYLGLPFTYGSFMRFIPIFQNFQNYELETEFCTIEKVFCINISYPITQNLMLLISDWEDSEKNICTISFCKYGWNDPDFLNKLFLITNEDDKVKYGVDNFNLLKEYRFPAGAFGVIRNNVNKMYDNFINCINKLVHKYKELKKGIETARAIFLSKIQEEKNEKKKEKFKRRYTADMVSRKKQINDVFGYGIDEIILIYLFYYEIYDFNNKLIEIYPAYSKKCKEYLQRKDYETKVDSIQNKNFFFYSDINIKEDIKELIK